MSMVGLQNNIIRKLVGKMFEIKVRNEDYKVIKELSKEKEIKIHDLITEMIALYTKPKKVKNDRQRVLE